MFLLGLRAAAQRLPFLPTRAGLGSDVLKINPHIKTVTSPYDDGEELDGEGEEDMYELDEEQYQQLLM